MSAETPRAADSLSLRLEELGRQVASARSAAEEAVADASRKAIGDVLEAVARIEEAGDQSAVLNALLEAGADPRRLDPYRYQALHFAAREGHLEAVQQLIRAGAEPDAVIDVGFTAADLAEAHPEVQDYLRALAR